MPWPTRGARAPLQPPPAAPGEIPDTAVNQTMMIGDEVLELRMRDSVVVRPELDRSFHNHTDQDCWLIVIGAPITEFTPEGIASYLAVNGYPPDTKV